MPSLEQKIIPLFKSNYSIGNSILTLENPDSEKYPNGPKSIFSILEENDLSEFFLLEDNFYSFYKSFKYCESKKIGLRYGINLFFSENKQDICKISIFIKNKDGYSDLIKINSIHSKESFLTKDSLNELFTENLILTIPFYDSFICNNSLSFCSFSDYLTKFNPVFFIEDNDLPFDSIIMNNVLNFANEKFEILKSKTIKYFSKKDIDAFLTYRCICQRGYSNRSLSKPNFSHFSSDNFCWESYLEKINDK